MPTDSGFSNQKKKGLSQFETVHQLGSEKYGKAVTQRALYEITAESAIVSVTPILGIDGQVKYLNIELTAHGARVNDVMRITSGVLTNVEWDVVQVIDVDNFYVLPITDVDPAPGDLATIMGWVSLKLSADGDMSIAMTSAPAQFIYDGIDQQVIQDTVAPANNRAMPTLQFIYKDGVEVPVSKNTTTPAQTIAMPVEVVAASGAPINIYTDGDVEMHTSSEGVNFDSMRIGNDTGVYLGINPDASINVQTVGSRLSPLNSTITPLTTSGVFNGSAEDVLQVSAITTTLVTDRAGTFFTEYSNDGLLWDYSETFTIVPSSPGTPESFTFSVLAECQYFRVRYINGGTPQGVFKMQTILKANAVSGEIHQVGFSLNARTEAQVTKGVIYGVTTGGGGGYVPVKVTPSGALAVDVAPAGLTPTFQEILNLTTVAQTFNAPSNAKWCKIYADDTNTAGIRVKMGGVATISSGIQFQAGRSEDYTAVANISVIAESGVNQKICVQFGT